MRQHVAQYSSGRNGVYFAIKQYVFTPQVLVDQMIVEPGKNFAKAGSLAAMFMVGAAAQVVGRAVGLGVGVTWLMSQKMREAADPKIRMRSRSLNEDRRAPVADEDKALV